MGRIRKNNVSRCFFIFVNYFLIILYETLLFKSETVNIYMPGARSDTVMEYVDPRICPFNSTCPDILVIAYVNGFVALLGKKFTFIASDT